MAAVELDNVSFSYPVFEVTGRSLKMTVMRQLVGSKIDLGVGSVEIAALSEISFHLGPGDRLGLVGRNGSGKSTMLRLLAGLAHPTKGRMRIEGRVLPLIDKGLGVNPELSGFDNIELPLRLLGASDAEVRRAKEEVPEFTGLGAFIHMPVRTYSEGMRARLAFALCTAIHGEVLLLDEWLGTGDADFYQRAQQRLQQMMGVTQIVVLATHSTELMKSMCNKVAWLDRGRLIAIGDPAPVIGMYLAAQQAGFEPVA
ncbi:MAG: ATP-binding cassette domain-containing protein [Alphaproteobacteria bacterium]|nr:ATP-binding cassette domain-containing protein [Alphaproteobacteria bacterium]